MSAKEGLLLVLGTAVISGISIFINSYGVQDIDSSIYTFAKNAVAAVLLFSFILAIGISTQLKKLTRQHWVQLAAIGLVGGSIPFLLFFKGLQLTTGTTASFIHKIIFLPVILLSIIFLKEKLHPLYAMAASLLLAGTYLIVQPAFSFGLGDVLIACAVLFWAVETVYAKHLLTHLSGTVVAFGRMMFGSAFILMYLLMTRKTALLAHMTATHYLWVGISSGFLLLYVLTYYNGLKRVSASTAACVLTIGVPITALLQFAFKGTLITPSQIVGFVFTILGTAAIAFVAWHAPDTHPHHGRA